MFSTLELEDVEMLDDIYSESMDAILEDVEKMDVIFKAPEQIYLYGTGDSSLLKVNLAEYIVKPGILLYESQEVAKFIKRRNRFGAIFKVEYNTRLCLDTLNIAHLGMVEKYYSDLKPVDRGTLTTRRLLQGLAIAKGSTGYLRLIPYQTQKLRSCQFKTNEHRRGYTSVLSSHN